MDVLFEVTVFARHIAAAPCGIDHAQVCLVGNVEELGSWDTANAVPLDLVEESAAEKKYALTVMFPVEREFYPLEYKYIIIDTNANEVVSWEAIPGNRTLTLTRATNVARDKPATQSSTYITDRMPSPGPRPASFGNNGNHNGFYAWLCPRTMREANPWWSVDLETTVELKHLNLWKAMTYHEQPTRSTARPPASSVAAGTMASALPTPTVRVFVSTEDLSKQSGEELINLVMAPGYLPEKTKVFQLDMQEDGRVERLDMSGIKVRYVRIQYQSSMSALQISEVEIFANDTATADDVQPLKRADGFFGVDPASAADLVEYVDSDWVDPRGDNAMVRLWVGSFQSDVPAIQWFDGSSTTRPVHVVVRHEIETREEGGDAPVVHVYDLPVDVRGASLLDKDSTKFRASLATYLHDEQRDLKPYVNSTDASNVDEWLQRFTNTQLFDDDQLAQLRAAATTCTFQDSEMLLQYGERTRTGYFILEGQVDIQGPPTVSGALTLGSLTSGAAINDLAVFSAWPTRSASFIARGRVVAQVITYEALMHIVGEARLRKLRRHLVREHHALNSSSPASTPGKLLVVDANHAQVFRAKVPMTALSSIPTASSMHSFTLEFYEAADGGTSVTSKQEKGALLGFCPLLPHQLSQHCEQHLTLPILVKTDDVCGGIKPAGQVQLHALVVRPFVHPRNNLANVWRSYWRERPPQNGGHRGMGRHFHQVGNFRTALTRENTLASLILAGRSGAEFVEFDVQLTKDDIPIVYHDFTFHIKDKVALQLEIPIHQLTLRELTRSETAAVHQKPPPLLQRLINKHWRTILGRPNSHSRMRTLLDPARGTVGVIEPTDDHLVDFYPRLEDLLQHVPPEIGLNVEIKYPDNFRRTAYRFSPSFAINDYLDTILRCVFDHVGTGRRLFFSCFDPDIVVALRAKQATYPVFFLSYGRVQSTFDARLTLQFAHEFVRMENLNGMVSNSDEMILAPGCVELIKRDGIALVTWGDQNTSHESVQLQKRHAVDGVISDNIGDLTRQDKAVAAAAKAKVATGSL